MARIILVVDPIRHCTYRIDDPRAPHNLQDIIHSHRAGIEDQSILRVMGARQWTGGEPGKRMLVVVLGDPPVLLSGRHYQVLLGLAHGQTCVQIARRLEISLRTVYAYLDDLKARFNVQTRAELLVQAARRGMLDPLTGGSEDFFPTEG